MNKKNLIDFDKLFARYPAKRKAKILKQARYLKAAMALRKLRKQLKLTQEKLARKMKVKREFISRAESGQQNLTLETFYQIAEATGKDFKFQFK